MKNKQKKNEQKIYNTIRNERTKQRQQLFSAILDKDSTQTARNYVFCSYLISFFSKKFDFFEKINFR